LIAAFCGTTWFAVRVLESMLEGEVPPTLVISPPPTRAGRGRSLTPAPVAEFARESGVELLESADVNHGEVATALAARSVELVVVCAFGQLIGRELISSHRFLNVHPSLVPRWRGAAPIERALLAGDEETGVSVMELTEGLDDGPVLGVETAGIGTRETYESLADRLADSACSVVGRVLAEISSGTSQATPQDESLATYAEKIDSSERRLSPESSAVELDRRVRALGGRLGTYLVLGESPEERLGVVECVPAEHIPDGQSARRTGEVLVHEECLYVVCAEGVLRLVEVKPAGGRTMSVADYLRGHDAPVRVL
jgi:methionyl-tRNA formyltransferase